MRVRLRAAVRPASPAPTIATSTRRTGLERRATEVGAIARPAPVAAAPATNFRRVISWAKGRGTLLGARALPALAALGRPHRGVGELEQRGGILRVVRIDSRAEARGDLQSVPAGAERGRQRALHALHHVRDQLRAVGRQVGEHHHELVAAPAAHHGAPIRQAPDGVGLPEAAAQSLGQLDQHLVARGVAQLVVHGLEVVDVEEDHAHPALLPPGAREPEGQLLLGEAAVRQARERVVQRLVAQLLLALAVLGHVAERAHRARPRSEMRDLDREPEVGAVRALEAARERHGAVGVDRRRDGRIVVAQEDRERLVAVDCELKVVGLPRDRPGRAVRERDATVRVDRQQRCRSGVELRGQVGQGAFGRVLYRNDRGDGTPRLRLALVDQRLVVGDDPAGRVPAAVHDLDDHVALGLAGSDAAQQPAVLGRDGRAVLEARRAFVIAGSAPEDLVHRSPSQLRRRRVAGDDDPLVVVHEHRLLERRKPRLQDREIAAHVGARIHTASRYCLPVLQYRGAGVYAKLVERITAIGGWRANAAVTPASLSVTSPSRAGRTAAAGQGRMPPALSRALPAWLDWATRAAVCLVAGLLVTAMPLAMAGAYHPAVGIPLALLAAGGLLWLARPPADAPRARGGAVVACALGAVAVAAVSAIVNAHFSAQHVVADRDPGIYLWFGRWLSHHGSLFLDNPRRFFPTVEHGVLAQCPVTCRGAPGDRLYVQFLHGLPVTLGASGWLGGGGGGPPAQAGVGGRG